MSSLLTDSYIETRIKNRLGYPLVQVEATSPMYDAAIADALALLNDYKPRVKTVSHTGVTTSDSDTYYIDFEDETVLGIRSVDFVTSDTNTGTVFDLQVSMMKGNYASGGNISEYVYKLDRSRMLEHLFAANDDWYFDYDNQRLILHVPGGTKDVFVEYFVRYTSPTELKAEDDRIFLDLSTAYTKIMIGRARSKFGGQLPGPGQMNMDGDTLLQEGQQELERLKERLERQSHDVDMSIG